MGKGIASFWERLRHHSQSYLLPRSSKARAGVVMASTSSGSAMPASMIRTLTLGFSAKRPATTQPEVPPRKVLAELAVNSGRCGSLSELTSNNDEVELLGRFRDGL